MTRHTCDILVVGGGPIAMALAIAADRSGFDVAMSNPDAVRNGPPLTISAGCWRLLHRIGVADNARHHARPIRRLEADGGCGALIVTPDDMPGNAGEEPLGLVISHADLIEAFKTRLASADRIRLTGSVKAHRLDVDGHSITCTFADQTSWRAGLVVACDGARSHVRALARIGQSVHRHDAAAVVFTVRTDHADMARQIFTRTGPAAMLPMTGGRAAIVWTGTRAGSRALMALSRSDFARQFAPCAHMLIRAPYQIDPESRIARYPITTRLSERLHHHRLALAGDAARTIHPLAGQGLNLGLKDVAALVHVAEDARRIGLDIGSQAVLADYARWRRADSLTMIGVTRSLAALFSSPVPIRSVAAVGLSVFGALAPCRRIAAGEAGSVLGALPRLLQTLDPKQPLMAQGK